MYPAKSKRLLASRVQFPNGVVGLLEEDGDGASLPIFVHGLPFLLRPNSTRKPSKQNAADLVRHKAVLFNLPKTAHATTSNDKGNIGK